MLFHVTWNFVDSSEEGQRRSLELFSKWQPGPAKFLGFYAFADGSGGMALVESDSATDLAKTVAPWSPWLEFNVRPLIPVQESAQINMEAIKWRDNN